jgi:rhomboid family GlyGly-CTERM serine protease
VSAAPRRSAWRRALDRPVVTVALGASAVLIALLPGVAEAAQLERALVAREPWRILSGHLSHFSAAHLAYDLAVFLALGWVCEARWPRRTRLGLCVALPACSAAVLLGAPELATYRGLSGLDSTLFVLLAARMHAERASRSAWMRLVPALALLGLLAKIAYELCADATLFAGGADLFVPVPVAHLAGGAIGLLAASWPAPDRSRSRGGASSGAAGEPATSGAR